MVDKVRKRDGRLEAFDQDKITNAIRKAFAELGREDGTAVKGLSDQVVTSLDDRFGRGVPAVEEVQDIVEDTLIRNGYGDVAKAYILYRNRHAVIREYKRFFGVIDDLKLGVNAIKVLQRRYLRRDSKGEVVETPSQMFRRVAHAIASVDEKYGERSSAAPMEERFYSMMANLEFLPNTPTLMNADTSLGQLSACFVIPIEDSLESIFDAVKATAIIHQSGGGTGFSFSKLRPRGDVVKTSGGVASGPVSFMKIFDATTEEIKQGGKRRGANMAVLSVYHPDIIDFVTVKSRLNILTNFNISVAVDDAFMRAVGGDRKIALVNPRNRKLVESVSAKELFSLIVTKAWESGDPGLIFIDEINRHNPTPQVGTIESTNPCVTGDTRISTEHGLMTMRELLEKHGNGEIAVAVDSRAPIGAAGGSGSVSLLSSEKGVKFLKITRAFRVGVKETFKVLTDSGYELECTGDHKILTNEGWVSATALNTGRHRVLIQSSEGKFRKSSKLPFGVRNKFRAKNGRRVCLNLPRRWSKELGQVVGLLIGDGWLRSGDEHCRVGFTFSDDDWEVMQHIEQVVNRWYGRQIRKVKRQRGTYHLSYHSKYLVEFFLKLGVLPVDSRDKRIPHSLFTATRAAVIGFLQGLFTADGTVGCNPNGTSYVRLTSKSLELLKDAQLLLLNLGMKSKIYNRSRGPRRLFRYVTKNGKITHYGSDGVCFELHVSRESMNAFLRKIGFLCGKNSEKLEKLSARSYYRSVFEDRVVSVTPAGMRPVYDLTEPVTFSFIANGIVSLDCGEQPLLPYESCNLGSINLAKMVVNGQMDWGRLERTVKDAVHFLDNVIDANRYPLRAIEKITRGNRKIGLGVMGFAEALIKLGVRYDSEAAVATARKIMKFMQKTSHEASGELARKRGPFPNFKESLWERRGQRPLRNATVTTIAPTGSISIIAGCSSGIEPLFAISFVRDVMEGTRLLEVNPLFEEMARKRGFYSAQLMMEIAETGSAREMKEVPRDVRRLFVTALDISPRWHVRIQAAFQEFTDNAVSKTINIPHESSPEEVRTSFLLAWKLRCKGITVYRYGSKPAQVLYMGALEKGQADRHVVADSEYAGGCAGTVCPS